MKNNNIISIVISALLIMIAGIVAGYVLSKTSNTTASSGLATPPLPNNNMSDHHGGSAAAPSSDALNSLVGNLMPDIQLSNKDGKTITTADFKGKNTVLFFNEGLMCYPACWNQIAAFGNDQRFNSDQIQAVSVVVDSAADWQRAMSKMPQLAQATTLHDAGAQASRQLGVLTTASSMHRGSLPGHTYILLDKEGIVRFVLDDPNMAIANDLIFDKIQEFNKK